MALLGNGPNGKRDWEYETTFRLHYHRVDDVALSKAHPKKAFIIAALEKEIRLSFAARIKGTLPEPYRPLISEGQEQDTPPFKYQSDRKFASPLKVVSEEGLI